MDGMNAADTAKQVCDCLAIGIAVAAVIEYLPAAAALLSMVWTAIRISETRTVRRWLARWRAR